LGGGRQLHVFCLHLGLTSRERRRQESLLLSADILRDAVRKDPVVVCGDFNYWGNGAVPSLVRKAIHDAALELRTPARTYPTRLPLLRLDRIFVDVTVKPLSIHPHRTALSAVASDHLPLVMRFEAPIATAPSVSAPAR
jgi:endonuclease/exonuclease/phosphatase family metal-dependent hydrolase